MQVARLILSSRNTYKINNKNAKKCQILSTKSDSILVGTSKEFSPHDNYVIVNTKTNELVNVTLLDAMVISQVKCRPV